jgi:uroporphyrinogen-III synthase
MAANPLAGLTVVSFEARRADELATLLTRQGATVVRAPALREAPLPASPEALALARGLEEGAVDAVVLLTGVGTRALAYVLASPCPRFRELLAGTRLVARGPKPLAALRELGVAGARAVPEPHTSREVLGVVGGLGLPPGALVAVQEYGAPVPALADGLRARGFRVLRVPVYRWALPDDTRPLQAAAARVAAGAVDVALFTNSAQVEHLFRVAEDADRVRAGLRRAVVASVGPVTSEALEAHGVPADLEASPPRMGPLAALVAARARAVLAAKRF